MDPWPELRGRYLPFYLPLTSPDSNPSDDELRYVINVTGSLCRRDRERRPTTRLENVDGLAVYQGLEVINTDTDYILNARGQATIVAEHATSTRHSAGSCGQCGRDHSAQGGLPGMSPT